jgi:eukaryotic-like serine/threonine-protein kinase
MIEAYLFERELLKLCAGLNLTKVIKWLDYGEMEVDNVPLRKLYLIISGIAEGDVRKYMSENGPGYLSWRLEVLHNIATGLHQLHKKGIFHQDVKPLNVLLFANGNLAKLGDLGRAHCRELSAPHDDVQRPGAFYYAPPEQLYDFQPADRLPYRQSADLYLLGSMLDFFVTGEPTTVRLVRELAHIHRPFTMDHKGWRGFFADVLPFLQASHADLVTSFHHHVRGLIHGGHSHDYAAEAQEPALGSEG